MSSYALHPYAKFGAFIRKKMYILLKLSINQNKQILAKIAAT